MSPKADSTVTVAACATTILEPDLDPETSPYIVTEEKMQKAWDGALALLREEGEDVDALLERAAANLAYFYSRRHDPDHQQWLQEQNEDFNSFHSGT